MSNERTDSDDSKRVEIEPLDVPASGSTTNKVWMFANAGGLLTGLSLLGGGGLLLLLGSDNKEVFGLMLLLSTFLLIPGAILVIIAVLSALLRVLFKPRRGSKPASMTFNVVRILLAIILVPIIVKGLMIVIPIVRL
jgi:hypothetical protein